MPYVFEPPTVVGLAYDALGELEDPLVVDHLAKTGWISLRKDVIQQPICLIILYST
jgi:hypothetical protein